MEAGKDVYCEKPMGNVLSETNEALAAVEESDRIVQIGTQRRSYPRYRSAMDMVKGGSRRRHRQGRRHMECLQPLPLGEEARGSGFPEGERHRLGGLPDGEALSPF